MKKYIFVALTTLLVGIFLGYLIFGGNQSASAEEDHAGHDHSMDDSTDSGEETWTCSMHPQIRQSEPGSCPICGMDLIKLEASTSNDPTILEMTEAAVALANIQTTTIGSTNANNEDATINLAGRVKSDERLVASQVAHVPGRIERLYVSFTGENVVTGQKLADIYSPDLITAQRELIEALSLEDVNPALVEAARNKLRYWKIEDEFIAKVEREKTIQEIFTLRADATGIVTERKVAVGDYLQRGEPLFNLVNLRKVWVLFDVYEDDLANIELGDRIQFTTPAISGRNFSARITFIDPVIDPTTRTASVRTEVNNPNGRLKPEMLVYGDLQNSNNSSSEALQVPKSAVLWTGTRSVVYVKLTEAEVPSFQYREVELGEPVGSSYTIINGLEVGDEVVTYGNFTIDAAAQLNNQSSMMNRDVSIHGRGVEEATATVIPDYQEDTPEAFREQLGKVVEAYLPLKDRMVATEAVEAALVTPIAEALAVVDMSLVKGEAHIYWMQQLEAIQAHANTLPEQDDVEAQREQFGYLSQALINALTAFGVDGTYYVQHCPMAFDNTGANWLSNEEQILNPYFGDRMLKCGMVTDEL